MKVISKQGKMFTSQPSLRTVLAGIVGSALLAFALLYKGVPLASIPSKESALLVSGKINFIAGGRAGSSFRIADNPYATGFGPVLGPQFSGLPGGHIHTDKTVNALWFESPGLFTKKARILLELEETQTGKKILTYENQRERLRDGNRNKESLIFIRVVAALIGTGLIFSIFRRVRHNAA